MKKLIVFSDMHGRYDIFEYLVKTYPDEVLVCLGDCEMNQNFYEENIEKCIFVRGNSDVHYPVHQENPQKYDGIKILERSTKNLVPKEILIECEGMKILLTHGHMFVKDPNLYRQEKGADLLLKGHSHHFKIDLDDEDNARVIDPGCSNARKVRDTDSNWNRKPPSYIELILDNGNIVEVNQKYYPEEFR